MEVLSLAPEHKTRYAARAYKAPEQQSVSAPASHETEVVIEPEEEEYLKRFYSTVRNPVRNASTVVGDEREIAPKPLVIKQIAVNELKIEDLEESGLAQTNTK